MVKNVDPVLDLCKTFCWIFQFLDFVNCVVSLLHFDFTLIMICLGFTKCLIWDYPLQEACSS